MSAAYSVGIDLGTSNCALTVAEASSGELRVLEVTQTTGTHRLETKRGLPSNLYLAGAAEFPEGALKLPWQTHAPSWTVGEFARDHGAMVTERLVTSAKSWLSNPHVDPRSAALPFQSQAVPAEEKVSAVEASTRYLDHLRQTLTHAEEEAGRPFPWSETNVVITVPASFEEMARQLTVEAAEAAGFRDVVLLEEPQAAFYAWLNRCGDAWRHQVSPGDVILVCDVGGGTSDFSLIAVSETDGQLGLERVSVGEHLLLGGDNMDLALAYIVQGQLAEAGHEIDTWQLWALVHACRQAKIRFFAEPELAELPIAIPARGSSLLAGSLSSVLRRESVESMILDGFFPLTSVEDLPQEGVAGGLQEVGLPYAAEPVISKHLAAFLRRSLENLQSSDPFRELAASHGTHGFLKPDAVLFNGGVFHAEPIRTRVSDLLASWNGGQAVRVLQGDEPDLAVAKGAAIYGRLRETGEGVRIRAGISRSYYVGLESAMPAIPGFRPPIKAVCVVPQGMEEGSELVLEGQEFGLVVGQPAEFRFFSSTVRSGDPAGEIVLNADKSLGECARLEATLPAMEGFPPGERIPVRIHAVVTELGHLQLWMQHTSSSDRWKLELEVREEA